MCILFFTGCRAERKNPQVNEGILDLRYFNFYSSDIVKIDGGWEFYYDQFVYPGQKGRNKEFCTVPGVWKGKKLADGTDVNPFGYATYRLYILTDSFSPHQLVLLFPSGILAYRLYINGIESVVVGKASRRKSVMIPVKADKMAYLPRGVRVMEVVLQVSNFHYPAGGIESSLYIGKEQDIRQYHMRNTLWVYSLIIICFVIGLYHLMLAFFRTDRITYISFGLFCILVALRSFCVEHLLYDIIGNTYTFTLDISILMIGYYAGVPSFVLFFKSLFKEHYRTDVLLFITAASLISALFLFISPPSFYFTYILPVFNLATLLIILYTLYVLIKAVIIDTKRQNIYMLIAFLFFCSTVINDILHSMFIIRTGFLALAGLAVFIFFYSVILSHIFTKTFKQVEELSKSLEKKVFERTKKLARANQRLLQVDEEKTMFIANVSHELRTPLNLIISPISGILEKQYGLTLTFNNPVFHLIHNNCSRLLNLIQNLLDFSKIELDKQNSRKEKINAVEFLKFYYSQVESFARSRGLDIEFENLCGTTELIEVDVNLFETAIYNLLSNAVKFTREGKIVLKAGRGSQNAAIHISVSDTGIGIAKEQHEMIFDNFTQADRSNTRRFEGTGIGLSLVHDFARTHHGEVVLESEPGKGSTFTLILPLAKKRDEDEQLTRVTAVAHRYRYVPQITPAAAEEGNRNGQKELLKQEGENTGGFKPVLLIVEDNPDMLRFMVESLESHYNIITARHGKEGLDKVQEYEQIDIIVSDIMTPVMDGKDFFKQLQQDSRYQHIPFIFCTARAIEHEKIQSIDEGALDYIYKPFSIKELQAKMGRLLDYKNRILELSQKAIKEKNSRYINTQCEEKKVTKREKEVILLLLQGKSKKEIAAELHIAINTSKRHIENIYAKLEICDRFELFALFTPPESTVEG